ncbi:MAG TPA: hypothetical protein VNL15_03685 [Dehalococcoidia bacterium]|nr:hypothetical protein [Dehalococcoidia bacterium]
MNLFRSEEHTRKWSGFRADYVENFQPLDYWLYRFSLEQHRRRGQPNYISWFVNWRVSQQREARIHRRRWPA